jgi:hypothetical protein
VGGSNELQHKKRRESDGGKNRDKKIVIVKLIILNRKKGEELWGKNPQLQQQKVQSIPQKFWTYSFGIQSWYWCLVFWAMWGRVLPFASDSLRWGRQLKVFFPLLSLVL